MSRSYAKRWFRKWRRLELGPLVISWYVYDPREPRAFRHWAIRRNASGHLDTAWVGPLYIALTRRAGPNRMGTWKGWSHALEKRRADR